MLNCLFVGLGGFIGAVCRYLAGLIPVGSEGGFPIKTLAINVIGALLLGLIAALAVRSKTANPYVVLMLKVGVCGGFTTFSTFAFETAGLLQNGSVWLAVLLSVAAVLGIQALVR